LDFSKKTILGPSLQFIWKRVWTGRKYLAWSLLLEYGVQVMMSLTQALTQYGYLALFVGSLIEGETMLLLAGFAAHRGYLSFPLVVAVAFCGGTLGDQTFFLLGRYAGAPLMARFPKMAARVQPVRSLIQRYHAWLIVMVRFMYGLRIAGPVVIGMSEVPVWTFALLNMLGALAWALLVSGTGYAFGQTLHWLWAGFKDYDEVVIVLLVVVAVAFGLYRRHRRGRDA
jgi:membrane protein DedA with SNARE-associated domain